VITYGLEVYLVASISMENIMSSKSSLSESKGKGKECNGRAKDEKGIRCRSGEENYSR
jgi:hypothetical protein